MRKVNLLFLMLLLPVCLFSQIWIHPDYKITGIITPEILKSETCIGAWKVKGNLDINKNGKKEIAILTDVTIDQSIDANNAIYWLEENDNGNYELLWSYSGFPLSSSWGNLAVGDVDLDGNQEIWVVLPTDVFGEDPNPPRVFCFEYDGTKMPDEPTLTWNLGLDDYFDFRVTSITIDDLDGDGEPELIFSSRRDDFGGSRAGRTLTIANYFLPIEQGGTDFGFNIVYRDVNAYLKGGYFFETRVVDFDGDGVKELWTFTWYFYTVNIFIPTTIPGQYEHIELRAIAEDDLGSREGNFFYDINGDGKMEGFVAGSIEGEGVSAIYVIEPIDNIRNITANNFKKLGFGGQNGNPSNFIGGCIGDFNNNGIAEFIVIDNFNNQVASLEYKGSGSLGDPNNYTFTVIAELPDLPSKAPYLQFAYPHVRNNGSPAIIIPNVDVYELSEPNIYIIQHRSVISVEKKAELPEGYSLSQNYPNPFNPSTNIEFSIPKATHVSLKVYNVLGQEVLTLINEMKEAGSYVVNFDAKNLPSGLYWYTIKTDNYNASKKMMLVK